MFSYNHVLQRSHRKLQEYICIQGRKHEFVIVGLGTTGVYIYSGAFKVLFGVGENGGGLRNTIVFYMNGRIQYFVLWRGGGLLQFNGILYSGCIYKISVLFRG